MIKILGISAATIIVCLILREYKPGFALIASLAGGLIITLSLIEPAKAIIDTYLSVDSISSVADQIIKPILKVLGLGYLTEFGANLAEDAGVKFLSNKIYLAGKISILAVCLPLAFDAFNIVLGLL